jgi:hypothetical protein
LVVQIAHDVSLLLDTINQDALRGRRRRRHQKVGIRRDDGSVWPEFRPVERALEVSDAEINMRGKSGTLRRRQVHGQETQGERGISFLVVAEHGSDRPVLRNGHSSRHR